MMSRRIIFFLYVVLLCGFGIGAGALFYDARVEYKALKQTQAASQARLEAAQARLREQQRVLDRLKTDPKFVERVLRERLHYAKQGEVIFRFDN
jgi:cell division protein DivIC